jgi:hypothetical protein
MIDKLHKLKKMQLEQQFMLKQQLVAKVFEIDKSVESISHDLSSVGVEKFGAIGDFKILAIHKNSLKYKRELFQNEKRLLNSQIEQYNQVIFEFQKDVEKYNYLLKLEIKEKIKKDIKNEELVASEFVQSKYAKQLRG